MADIHNVPVYISTAEDIIVVKLLWYKDSDIQKHFDDAFGIVEIQQGKLDTSYIKIGVKHWP